jgi:hypothetical protein
MRSLYLRHGGSNPSLCSKIALLVQRYDTALVKPESWFNSKTMLQVSSFVSSVVERVLGKDEASVRFTHVAPILRCGRVEANRTPLSRETITGSNPVRTASLIFTPAVNMAGRVNMPK